MSESLRERLEAHLEASGVPFRVRHHEPTRTSRESARARGTSLASGAKALLCKGDSGFVLVVMSADRRLKSLAVRRHFRWRGVRFARADELAAVAGVPKGAVPPFGSLLGVPTLCDESLAAQEQIHFNAGDLTVSVSMAYVDWVALERPRLGAFAAAPAEGDDADPPGADRA